MKRGLFLIAALLGITQIWAYTCKVNLICYDLHYNDHTATVTYSGQPYNNDYTGHYGGSGLRGLDIQIPTTISYNGEEYTVTAIGDKAFYDCESAILIASITIPSTVTSIGDQAFYRCTNLTSLDIPNSVTSISSSAFMNCFGLTSVTIPNSVTSIGSSAFEGCSSLTNITIPNSVKSIGDHAFFGCGLTSIQVASGNTTYDSRNNCNAIIETASNTLIAGSNNTVIPNSVTSIGYGAFSNCSGLTSVTIPNSVTSIGGSTFYGCHSLTNVSIPNSVTSIGGSAFAACHGLMSVSIPNSVTSIGESTFSGCSSLTSVTIPNSVTNIGSEAFWGCCSMTSVTIPNSVTNIGYSAFEDCSGLTSVTVERDTPVNIGKNTFSNRNNATLFVPYGRKAAYEIANYWKEFKEIVEMEPIPVEVTDISQIDNVIFIEPMEVISGNQAVLSVKMKNNVAIQTIQFDLYLPDGVTVVANEDQELVTASKARINKFNFFNSTMQSNGALRLLAQATTANVPVGDGEICRVTVNVPEDMEESDYPIIFKDMFMVESDNTSHSPDPNIVQCKLTVLAYTPGDANNDGGINAIDFNMVGNYILGNHSQANFSFRAADFNDDGDVNAIDFNMVANYILYGSSAPSRAIRGEKTLEPQ